MASSQSWRCLARTVQPAAVSRFQPALGSSAASFSTTSALTAAQPPAIKSRRDLPKAIKKSFNKKKGPAVPAKKPNPGERKAFRKRIQLSNNSALVVSHLGSLTADTMANGSQAGKVFGIPDEVVDQLRTVEAFKPTQAWGLFRRPHMLVRDETAELVSKMKSCARNKEALRLVLTGSRLSGKSTALIQALTYALMNEWVVLHIPEGQDLTNGNLDFTPVPDTEPMQFAQPTYTLKLLQQIYKANKTVLEKLDVQKSWPNLAGLKKGATLADLALNAKEGDAALPSLQALWTEWTLPGRPPVLFTLDGVGHVNKMSEYRDPSFNQVHGHDLAIVRMFVNAISGTTALPNGGAIIAATSESNVQCHPSQALVLSQLEAGQKGTEIPKPDPYFRKYDNRVYDALKNCQVLRLEGVSKEEARALMEYWGMSGLLRTVLDARTVSEKWALGGHGLVGEMERAALQTLRM